jgi:hypothetical protein
MIINRCNSVLFELTSIRIWLINNQCQVLRIVFPLNKKRLSFFFFLLPVNDKRDISRAKQNSIIVFTEQQETQTTADTVCQSYLISIKDYLLNCFGICSLYILITYQ